MKRIVNVIGKLTVAARGWHVLALCAITASVLPAQTLTTPHSFDGTDGGLPMAGLVQATDGNLYGTTVSGGANRHGGTVFKISPSGTLTTLYSFCSQSACTDGEYPYAGLVQAANGNFYGTTYQGGTKGLGTVFVITPSGDLTTLYSFCSQTGCPDGAYPQGTLVQSQGVLYGTTSGGANGTVFKITPSGELTTLYTFCSQTGCADGSKPSAGLIQGMDGDFYGTTSMGGTGAAAPDSGTVFKITAAGAMTTLYSFCSLPACRDGGGPVAGLAQASNGDLYGTTQDGGNHAEGTIFKITPSGALTTLYNFCSQAGCTDGSYPNGGLIQATDGNLYGTTSFGGSCPDSAAGCGTIFKVATSGTLTTLYNFCAQRGCANGDYPGAVLVQDTNGEFYGTTNYGGASIGGCSSGNGCGTVFSLSEGLGLFAKILPVSGQVAAQVRILGTNLTGTTSVTFDGIAAVFQVISNSEITATVPAGASSGEVQVVTPGGTLSSNVSFQVVP